MDFIDKTFHRLACKINQWQQQRCLPDGGGKPRQEGQSLTDSKTRRPLASGKAKEQILADLETRKQLANDQAEELILAYLETRKQLANDKAKEQILADLETRKQLANGKARKQESCAFLQLPLELILNIADMLPQYGQVVLSQSCHALRVALKPRCGPSYLLPPNHIFEFITCIARNRPDHFACHYHKKIRPINYNDHPMVQRTGKMCKVESVTPLELADGKPYFQIAYEHCQLALKTMRIFGSDDPVTRPQRHLQRFLAPHHRTVRHFEGSLNIQLSVYPRIVGNRFLLFNEWRIEKEARKVCTTEGIHGHILVCRHQEYSQDAWLLPPGDVPEAGALCEAFGQLASQPPDFEARGACASCSTDFSVQGTRNRCLIRSWQDLGCEGVATHFLTFLSVHSTTNHHEPGSVRRLYEAVQG